MSFVLREKKQTQAIADGIFENIGRRVAASPEGVCPVDVALSYVEMCHAQTCGKCTPCRVGLGQVSSMMRKILDGKGDMEMLNTLRETAQVIRDSADCAIGTNAAEIVLNGLEAYKDEYLAHILEHRCLASRDSSIPCSSRCPAEVDIPGYIGLVSVGENDEALKLIRKDNPFATACAYICTHPCEKACRRTMLDAPLNIRGIKKYAVDNAGPFKAPKCAESTGKTVAVIGGGPGGVTAAYYLTLMGHKVTIYERMSKLGGMLRYGIPSYRFPREKLDKEIEELLSVGIEVKTGVDIGTDISFEDLKKKYDSIFIAIGAQGDNKVGIDGETAKGVIPAVNLLRGIGDGYMPDMKGMNVVIVGGGNVAMDATRTSIRSGAKKVSCVYRRRLVDMTADEEEVQGALAEGAEMITLNAPVRVETDKDGKAVALITQPQVIGAIDKSGRPRPEPADAPEKRIEADLIIMAIGQAVMSEPFEKAGMATKRGCILAGNNTAVSGFDGVFAGGDCVTGPDTAIRAIAAGKAAASAIDKYLGFNHTISVDVTIPEKTYFDKKGHGRVNLTEREASERKNDFKAIENEMTNQEAAKECGRCLHCDYYGCGNFKGGRKEQW